MVESLQIVSPYDFFHGYVSVALQKQRIVVKKEVESYLTNLLVEFIQAEKIKNNEQDLDYFSTPIALLLNKALESSSYDERMKIFKGIGDTTLYISGYFQNYFNRKTYNVGYYIDMGIHAYSSVSSIVKDKFKDQHFSGIYQNLADNFSQFVEVVSDVSEEISQEQSTNNVLALYERWQVNNSDRLRKKLEENGIIPLQHTVKNKQ